MERLLLLSGLAVLAWGGIRLATPRVLLEHPSVLVSAQHLLGPGTLHPAGKMEIPRIGLSVLVLDGREDQALEVGAAHLAGSAELGGEGNAIVAGHRDEVFRDLRHLRLGDRIFVESGKHFEFEVESIRVVQPDNVSVLRSGPVSRLTLITCFPFYFVGDAPKRFVVTARRVEN